MAPKKKGKKGKKKGGKKKKIKGLNETPEILLRRLLKNYDNYCKASDSVMIPYVKTMIRNCIENNQLWVKIIVEPLQQLTKEDPQVRLEPLIAAIRGERYTFIKDIYIWDLWLRHENVAALALLLEKGFYTVRMLELQDCLLEPEPVARLSLSFNRCKTLTIVSLDYNEFGDAGCRGLCHGLTGNKTILSLSLCYCNLGVKSGEMLGTVLAATPIRDLYLDGNNLGAEGVIALVGPCAEFAELEALQKFEEERRKLEDEQLAKEKASVVDLSKLGSELSVDGSVKAVVTPGSAESGKGKGKANKGKKKRKKKKKKLAPGPPPCGPWVHKLHLADNGIDVVGAETFAPLVCMRILKKLITFSSKFEELDLGKNLIGDLGARTIMQALAERKHAKLPSMGIKVTHRISAEVFASINKLGSGVKKKKRRKGKKKGKKRK